MSNTRQRAAAAEGRRDPTYADWLYATFANDINTAIDALYVRHDVYEAIANVYTVIPGHLPPVRSLPIELVPYYVYTREYGHVFAYPAVKSLDDFVRRSLAGENSPYLVSPFVTVERELDVWKTKNPGQPIDIIAFFEALTAKYMHPTRGTVLIPIEEVTR